MAAVLFGGEGCVVSVTIDNARNRVAFDEEIRQAIKAIDEFPFSLPG